MGHHSNANAGLQYAAESLMLNPLYMNISSGVCTVLRDMKYSCAKLL